LVTARSAESAGTASSTANATIIKTESFFMSFSFLPSFW